MRRSLVVLAAALLAAPLAVSTSASAAPAAAEYTLLNETGLKQALIKKPLAPRWFGNPSGVAVVYLSNQRPVELGGQKMIQGQKADSLAASTIDYPVSGRSDKISSIVTEVYQYADVQTAMFAWEEFSAKFAGLAGSWEHTFRDKKGKAIGKGRVIITVAKGEQIYGQDSWIISTDIVIDDKTPKAIAPELSMDTVDVWASNGAAITHVSVGKFVKKVKNWCLSQGETNTAPVLAQLLTQRYHHSAVKTL